MIFTVLIQRSRHTAAAKIFKGEEDGLDWIHWKFFSRRPFSCGFDQTLHCALKNGQHQMMMRLKQQISQYPDATGFLRIHFTSLSLMAEEDD